jgi:CBS domain-containing protein
MASCDAMSKARWRTRGYVGPALEDAEVHHAMRVGLITCRPETRLSDVARMMAGYDVHSVVVARPGERERPWGVVTSLDLARAAGDLDSLTAADVASTDLFTIASNESLRRAAELMSKHRVGHLIVVQPDSDDPVGVLSADAITAVIAHGRS